MPPQKQLSILFLSCQGYLNGATYSLFYLANGLAEKGHKVFVGCPTDCLLAELLQKSNAHFIPFNFTSKVDFKSMKQIKFLVKKHNIQIINAQATKDRYTSIFARWLYNLPCKVVHTRRQKPMSSFGWIQNKLYVWGTDKVIVISHQLKKTLIENGYPASHIHVIYNGMPQSFFRKLDANKIEEIKQSLNLQTTETVIGCFARKKEQTQLVDALPYLNNKVRLLFAGIEADFFEALKNRNTTQNKLTYLSKIPRSEIQEYYGILDIFVLPSNMDGFGLVLVEAMGYGVPVVGTKAYGIIDVLDEEKNGLWFENNNPKQLAKKLNQIITDKNLNNNLINNGKHAAFNTFTLEKTIDNYENFFIEISS